MSDADPGKINAVVFYGYTKNQQTNGMLPGYPPAQTKVFCRDDDGVCGGALVVSAGHLAYTGDGTIDQGASSLVSRAGK